MRLVIHVGMKIMKILIVEDKQIHRDSAVKTLKGHKLTIVDTFDAGIKAMPIGTDYKKLDKLAVERFGPTPESGQARTDWYEKLSRLIPECQHQPEFDAVLVDMMMPMSRETLAPGVYESNAQVPYGFVLALRACRVGAKYVAMITDTNHHKGAMSAAIDHLGSAYYSGYEPPFEINGAKVLFVHSPFVERSKPELKDWGQVLKHLIDGPKKRS